MNPLDIADSTIDTPALTIDLSRLKANIARMAHTMAENGVSLRPHFKTSKMIEVARTQLEAGAIGFTCATSREIRALLNAGIDNIFWANSTATPAKAKFAAELTSKARLTVGLDSLELAILLNNAAESEGVKISCLLEIDTGLHRTGVTPDSALKLAQVVAELKNLHIVGVYMHEGHLASICDSRDELRKAGNLAATILVSVAQELLQAGHQIDVVSVGSTPGWDSAPLVDGVTEARPGTYVFFDANQIRLESTTLENCALTVRTTVVSTHQSGSVVIDAGIKAMSSDPSNKGLTWGIPLRVSGEIIELLEFTKAYEEHGILEGVGAKTLRVGDVINILPNHACGVVNMWSNIYVVNDGIVVETWSPVGRY
jgi:D-serine deaminase-like pyridoxal phosphate-dependent protein